MYIDDPGLIQDLERNITYEDVQLIKEHHFEFNHGKEAF